MKIVCLCGSARFVEAFQDAYVRESVLGNVVLRVSLER